MPHLSLHIIHSMPPNNINRDDSGAPKSSEYGGARRAMPSPQSWKRAIRLYSQGPAFDLGDRAHRTRRLRDMVGGILAKDPAHSEHADALAQAAVWCLGFGVRDEEPRETSVLVFATDREARDLSAWAAENAGDLLDAYQVAVEAAAKTTTPRRRRGGPGKTAPATGDTASVTAVAELAEQAEADITPAPAAAPGPAPAVLAAPARAFFRNPRTVDTALFGRMLAEIRGATHDGALSVAPPISTHRTALQRDYFTAADDVPSIDADGVEKASVGMIGETLYQAAVLYRYASLDIRSLAEGLDGDLDLTERCIAMLVEAFMLAMPTGKQRSFAAHTPPMGLLVCIDRIPISLAEAFQAPIEPRPGARLDVDSWNAMGRQWRDLQAMLARSTPVGYLTPPSFNLTGPTDEWTAWQDLTQACTATARASLATLGA